ncbi:hypothetical protein SAMN04488090_2659 [Siphonobacter aquaeclarae]|uniref:Outer membrane protein beta-barrel domain-containing protein n=2 Tax=Siphonobacter aquaeclarae TaxID=563176 RepID=A0A1G9QKH1_9BACT|nr:hypothetical protein SAMN04488090_2659 [Siphonobacter aquaeclarae]
MLFAMLKRLFILLLMGALPHLVHAQADYKTAIGVRLGASNGLSVKGFLSNKNALEGILTTRWRGIGLTGLYEVHGNAFQTRSFNWYVGGGAHIYTWREGKVPPPWWDGRDRRTIAGLDGILGLEYTIPSAPLNFSIDWKPAINIVNYEGFWGDEFAFSIRFAIK